jgi:hypothetical protein
MPSPHLVAHIIILIIFIIIRPKTNIKRTFCRLGLLRFLSLSLSSSLLCSIQTQSITYLLHPITSSLKQSNIHINMDLSLFTCHQLERKYSTQQKIFGNFVPRQNGNINISFSTSLANITTTTTTTTTITWTPTNYPSLTKCHHRHN